MTGLIFLSAFVFMESDLGKLFAFGPSPTLEILNVRIDTWPRYLALCVGVMLLRSLEVLVNDIGSPNLGFSIYNPTQVDVYGFSKLELQLLANGMFTVNALGYIFKTLIIVTRMDLAIISTLAAEATSVFTIRYLLNQKRGFYPDFDTEQERSESLLGGGIPLSDHVE